MLGKSVDHLNLFIALEEFAAVDLEAFEKRVIEFVHGRGGWFRTGVFGHLSVVPAAVSLQPSAVLLAEARHGHIVEVPLVVLNQCFDLARPVGGELQRVVGVLLDMLDKSSKVKGLKSRGRGLSGSMRELPCACCWV